MAKTSGYQSKKKTRRFSHVINANKLDQHPLLKNSKKTQKSIYKQSLADYNQSNDADNCKQRSLLCSQLHSLANELAVKGHSKIAENINVLELTIKKLIV